MTNASLQAFVASEANTLEVVVPAGKGHVYFRLGEKVYDFSETGLRVGDVRPIGGERYGFLVRLEPSDLDRLRTHLRRLERTGGAELGAYDFEGEKGFHCVTWLTHLPIGSGGESVLERLGATRADGESMPAFANFLIRHVPEQIVYAAKAPDQASLDRMSFRVVTIEQLVAQREAEKHAP